MIDPEIQQLFVTFQNTKKRRLKARLNVELEDAIITQLKEKDTGFNSLLLQNNALMANNSVKFKVYQEGGGPWGTHAKVLEGKVHSNGHIYLQTTKQMSPFIPFATNVYPTRFSGSIKWNGNIKLDSTETDFNLFGSRVPQLFEGRIDVNGKVEMKVVESDFDLYGYYLINKLICDPFKRDELKRKRYIDNLSKINRIFSTYINELKQATHKKGIKYFKE